MSTRLFDSFGAVYRLLERPRAARWVLAGLLLIHTLLLGYSAYVHSPTLNEPAHLVAGLSHWKLGRFDVYNVNPPLIKLVAALPVMAVGYNEDWSGFYEGPGARPEMGMGENFVAANGERSFFLFMIARWACIPFSWLGMIVCFLWARDLYGRPAGVMAAAIWCFEPNILAHASLITPDAGATALGLAACYTFWRWLKKPTWTQAALTGVVLGLAELTKTTLILFYPLWPIMWLIYRWSDRTSMLRRDWLRQAGMLALRMVIGLYVLNLGYGFEGSFTQLRDFTFVSYLFTGKASIRQAPIPQSPAPSPPATNRFANTWLANLPAPFPKNYILGIDVQQRDFEHYSRPSYLRGMWQDHGWWYFYLYACAVKVPLGHWLLGLLAIMEGLSISIQDKIGRRAFARWSAVARRSDNDHSSMSAARSHYSATSLRDHFILCLPPMIMFAVVSSKTGFSEHMRYVLPVFPYAFIAISGLCQQFSRKRIFATNSLTMCPLISYDQIPLLDGSAVLSRTSGLWMARISTVAFSLCWLSASSLWSFPHSLSYFNESVGGPLYGAQHLIRSSIDWSQDYRYVKGWQLADPKKRPVLIGEYASYSPAHFGVACSRGDERGLLFQIAIDSCIVSVNDLMNSEPLAVDVIDKATKLKIHELRVNRAHAMSSSPLTYSFRIIGIRDEEKGSVQ